VHLQFGKITHFGINKTSKQDSLSMKMVSAMMLGTEQEFNNHTHHRKLTISLHGSR
jgi:hypothetical protein